MKTHSSITFIPAGQIWPRIYLVRLLETALLAQEFRFARQAALGWLAVYPGDLPVRLLRAQALAGEGHLRQALPVLEELVAIDPEYLSAQETLGQIQSRLNLKKSAITSGMIQALGSKLQPKSPLPLWSDPLTRVRKSLEQNDLAGAERGIHEAFAADPQNPLTAVTHLRLLWRQNSVPLLTLARHYHQRWPDCLPFTLILADALMVSGEPGEGVALLHRAVSQDLTAQVAERFWGPAHPYQALWPENLETVIEIPIPAGVAAAFGWNILAPGELIPASSSPPPEEAQPDPSGSSKFPGLHPTAQARQPKHPDTCPLSPEPSRENPHPVQKELEKLGHRLQRNGLAQSDGRFPVYVVFSTRRGLQKQYGRGTAAMLDEQLRQLIGALRRRLDWGAIMIYGDDPANLAEYGLKPAAADDPWALKLVLADLDAALTQQGAMIGALLIVGGPQVVPFHHLPNPTDDQDVDVPSDNPYATRNENYFLPEWPVGRLPGGAGQDPGLLLSNLRTMTEHYAKLPARKPSRLQNLWAWLTAWLEGRRAVRASLGYSAEIWLRASRAVFQPIGEERQLISSPPITAEPQQAAGLPSLTARLAYFNLHGLADTNEWYGQRDPAGAENGPDYPVALRPMDVVNGGRAPQIVFSEACYGGHVIGKDIESALALKFLASGSQAVVGSTVISYGSITTPLNAADLLGKAFWQDLKAGYPVGEALRRAKIHLAREMTERQGYLDGEDQKTLISFLLYGDPLVEAETSASRHRSTPKSVQRSRRAELQVKTICDKAESPGISDPIPGEVMAQVKQVVETYLPGMRDAQLTMSYEHLGCDCHGHNCPSGQLGPKGSPELTPQRRVVTLSKNIQRASRQHPSYARLTLNAEGKVVKLAVSR